MFLHLGPASWGVAILLSTIFLGIIIAEIWRYGVKNKDRGFWSGLSVLAVIFIMGLMSRYGWEWVSSYQAENEIENPVVRGSMSAKGYYIQFPHITEGMCVADKTIESKQCQFLMIMAESDVNHVPFISSEKESIIRYGTWPFHRSQIFPPIIFKERN